MNTKKSVISAIQASLQDGSDPEILKRLAAGENIPFSEMDLNSLRMVEISMFLDDELSIEIDFDSFEKVSTIDQLVQLCDDLLA